MKKTYHFGKVDIGDFIKFKTVVNNKDDIYFGKVVDVSRNGFLGIQIDTNDKRMDFPLGLHIYIDRRSVLQTYPSKYIEHLTPRLALKHLWKDLIFREVKTTLCSKLLYAEYKYISKTGFEKIKRFTSLEEAYRNVSSEYHKNIIPCYDDYFGFTITKALRTNDHYYDREIFFSKKCYTELDWSSNPTGDFMLNEKGFNLVSPISDSIICGIVEDGEKGLFYRKWFICSKEFLTLWTMVCIPKDCSLFNQKHIIDDRDISKIVGNLPSKRKNENKIKNFDNLMKELDTSHYSIDMKSNLFERRRKHCIYNLERTALYFPNRYKQIAEILFSRRFLEDKNGNSYSEETEYTSFQKKLIRNLMWSKKVN